MTRDEAIKILSYRDGHGMPCGYNGGYAEAIEVAIEALKDEPVKHGHWISKFENGKVNTYCSACGNITYGLYHYCPDCGAKMDLTE